MTEPEKNLTLKSLFLFIYESLDQLLKSSNSEKFTSEDKEKSGAIFYTIQTLSRFASENENEAIYEIIDDFEYINNHINLANFKSETVLKEVKAKIDKL